MLRWIFLAQAIIYLLLMPVLRSTLEFGYRPSLGSGILTVLSLLVGYALYNFRNQKLVLANGASPSARMYPKGFLVYAVPLFAAAYAFTVLYYGLLNRRQGSEVMAEIYGQLPIYALFVLRVYEILIIPLILIYIFTPDVAAIQKRVVLGAIVLSLPFTGIIDSRSKLLIILLYVVCFISVDDVKRLLFRHIKLYIIATFSAGAFLFYSAQRLSNYLSFNEFLLVEVYQRLDGLSLVTDLRDAGSLNKSGQFDFAMFNPLLSRVPFLEAAKTAKLMGQTSSKQYYLQEVLGRKQLDTPNSMIADPLYFAGWAGIIVAFVVLGYLIAANDGFVRAGKLFRSSKNLTAVSIAFVTSFVLIENDFVGAPLSFIQSYIVIFGFFVLATINRMPLTLNGR